MRPRWHLWWRVAAVAIDAIALAVALGGAAALRFGPFEALELVSPETGFLAPWLLALPIWIVAFAGFGLYNAVRWANAVDEARRIGVAGLVAPIAFVVLAFLSKQSPSRFWVGAGALLALGTVATGRRGLRWMRNRIRRRGGWLTPAVVVGRREAKRVVDDLAADPTAGYLPVATCGFTWNALPHGNLAKLGELVQREQAGAVLLVSHDLERDELQRAIAVADEQPASVILLPGLDYTLAHSLHVVPVGHEPAIVLETPSLRPHQATLKRAVDIGVAAAATIVLLPLLALIALAVRLDSRGPALFGQQRVGRNGRSFKVLKFRTMIEGAHERREELDAWNESDGLLFKIRDDPRVTRVGRFLRRWSLDELPQLVNVLLGEMSLVGPRPAVPDEAARYDVPLMRRLSVRPGMTGLWQINGRSELPFEEYLRLDLTYVQNWSLLLDFYVMLRTVPAVVSGRGAC